MLISKKCGCHQEDEMTIKFMKRKWPHTEEHDIYYFCGACLDNATDEEYENMMKLMDNPRFNRTVKDLSEALDKSMSYDEWAGREYGEDKVDIDDTADNLAANGIVKDTALVSEIIDEIEEVVDKWNTTIGSIFIKKKLNEIRARYGIIEGEQKHTSHIANQIYNELMIHAYYPAEEVDGLIYQKIVDEDDIRAVCGQYIEGGLKDEK